MIDTTLPPPLFTTFGGDEPRARRIDPIQSHMAADRSAKSLPVVKRRVLRLLAHPDQKRVSGNELNRLYREAALRSGWTLGHFDTARKRSGELARDGLLKAEREIDGRTLPEAVYTITQRGLAALVNEVNL